MQYNRKYSMFDSLKRCFAWDPSFTLIDGFMMVPARGCSLVCFSISVFFILILRKDQ